MLLTPPMLWLRPRSFCHRPSGYTAMAVIAACSMLPAAGQQDSQRGSAVTIHGTVRDDAGMPVADAMVHLESKDGAEVAETKTNPAGDFQVTALRTARYLLVAEKGAIHSRTVRFAGEPSGEPNSIDLILDNTAPGSAASMQFSDTPSFTVAGVTDWTAVGGHGSDSTLRTSEALARATADLSAQSTDTTGRDATLQQLELTENRLRAALAGAPGSFEANRQLGKFYLQAGRSREAVPLLESAYRLNPSNDSNTYDLALACEQIGDYSKARDHVAALLAHRNDADLHRLAGELDEKLGDPLAAVREYEQAVREQPSEQNYFEWGSELLLHRAVWQAQDVFRRGTEAWPHSGRMLTALGAALFAGALYDQAAARLCEASDLNPADTKPYRFMGRIESAAPDALPCIEPKLARFAREQPENAQANYLYAMAILKREQAAGNAQTTNEAEGLLRKAVALDPKCAEAWLELGILAASRRDFVTAIGFYTRAIDVNPQMSDAHYRLGVAYDRTGQASKASQEFQLHDDLEKTQAAAVERQRREIQQFLFVQSTPAVSRPPGE